jgi:hypothetical protein
MAPKKNKKAKKTTGDGEDEDPLEKFRLIYKKVCREHDL